MGILNPESYKLDATTETQRTKIFKIEALQDTFQAKLEI